jgi:hypothetical protein
MGGAVRAVSQVVGIAKKPEQAVQNVLDSASGKKESTVSRSQEEDAARMRASRRRGRQLLSDARLNPEGGVQTLGGGSNLG